MDENYRLEKEYKIPFEIFREGYTAFQKKYIFPKSYVYMAIFAVLAISFIAAAVQDPSQYMAYMLIVICTALGVRQWYNPRKLRQNLFDTVHEMGETVYKLGIGNDFIEFSTIELSNVENSEENEEEYENPLPEKSRIPLDKNFSMLEYERFFLLFSGKEIFYIVPKEDFSADELDMIRQLQNI